MTGRDEYKAICAELAAEHGYQIRNPELREAIEQHKRRFESEPERVAEVPVDVPKRRRRPRFPAPGGP